MPLFLKEIAPIRGIWKVEETSEQLLSLLNEDSQYHFIPDEIRTEKRRQEWVAVRLLVKELIGREVIIAYHPSGSPYLPDSSLHISISHTKGYVAVLLQEEPFAGIDLEYRGDRVLKIRSRFLSDMEEKSIDLDHEADHILIYWCAKEALFKMIGQTDVDFKNHLHIEPFPYNETGIIRVNENRTNKGESYSLVYQVFSDFIIVWSLVG